MFHNLISTIMKKVFKNEEFVWTDELVLDFVRIYHKGKFDAYSEARTVGQKMAIFKSLNLQAYKKITPTEKKSVTRTFLWGLFKITKEV
jgi:hypothetical protein